MVTAYPAPGSGWRVAVRLAGRVGVAEADSCVEAIEAAFAPFLAPLYAFYAPPVALVSPCD